MEKKTLLFRLRKDATAYYYMEDGVFTSSPAAIPEVNLEESIIDWDKIEITWKRHSNYWGVFRASTLSTIRFCNDGAKILRYIFNKLGNSEAIAELEIMKLNTTTQQYYQLVVFALDFSTFKSSRHYVDIHLMEGGKSALLNAYDTTNYSILIGEPQGGDPQPPLRPTNVFIDGVPFIESYDFETKDGGEVLRRNASLPLTQTYTLVATTRENLFFNGQDVFSIGTAQSVAGGGAHALPNFIFNFLGGSNIVRFTGTLNIDAIVASATLPSTDTETFRFYMRHLNSGGATIEDILLYESPAITQGQTINPGIVNISMNVLGVPVDSITANPGDYFVPWCQCDGAGNFDVDVHLNSVPSKIKLSINSVGHQQLVACYTPWQLFQMLIDNLICTNPIPAGTVFPLTPATAGAPVPVGYNNLTPPVKSDLLTTPRDPSAAGNWDVDPTATYYTSGNALRQLQYFGNGSEEPILAFINMNIKDFLKEQFVSLCAGLGIEKIADVDTFVIEHLSHFLQKDVVIASVGRNVSRESFMVEPFTEHIGNNIRFGYKDQSYSDANGNFEFNKELNFSTTVQRTQQDIDLLSPVRADAWGAEIARINTKDQNSTDAKSDSEVFKFQSDGNDAGLMTGEDLPPYDIAPYYPPAVDLPAKFLKRGNGVAMGLPQMGIPTGVATKAYNVPLSPKRQALRLLPWLKSNYYGIPNPVLKFQSTSRKANLETSMLGGAGNVIEWADIDLSSDGSDILFKPVFFEFDALLPADFLDQMSANSYGVIQFEYINDEDKSFVGEGFVMEAHLVPARENVFHLKLLCSPNTDIPEWL